MQDRTINNALLAIRKDGGEAQELADRLLRLRGVEPPRIVNYCRDPMGRRQMRSAILGALQDGPKAGPDIVRHIMRDHPDWSFKLAQRRVSTTMTRMKDKGLLRREGRVWLLPRGER